MRKIGIILLLLAAGCSAASALDKNQTIKPIAPAATYQTPPCVDRFPNLPEIAQRLGVEPSKLNFGSPGLRMCDGRTYDAFDLMMSALTRVDELSRKAKP